MVKKSLDTEKEVIPPLSEVAKPFTAKEAFSHAATLYKEIVSQMTPLPSAKIVTDIESKVFRPATELQFAGLSLFSGKYIEKPLLYSVSLASFAVDHLLWGWNASVLAQVGVAFTLARAAVEAAIFEIASATNPSKFEKDWNTPRGTGGAFLRELGNVTPRVQALLDLTWQGVVAYGHAGAAPVMSSVSTAQFESGWHRTMTFAGQYAGPLDASTLQQLSTVYSLASTVAVEAMNIALYADMNDKAEWKQKYLEFQKILDTREPVPDHLREYYLDDEWRRKFSIPDK